MTDDRFSVDNVYRKDYDSASRQLHVLLLLLLLCRADVIAAMLLHQLMYEMMSVAGGLDRRASRLRSFILRPSSIGT